MKSTTIFELRNKLKIHFQLLNDKTQVSIAVQNSWGTQKMWLVKQLVCHLFALDHPDECHWFRVISGSVILVFLVHKEKVGILIERSKEKIQFMRLCGVLKLSIGTTVILEEEENTHYAFSISLAEARKHNHKEARQFLLQCDGNEIGTSTTYSSPKTRTSTLIKMLSDLSKHISCFVEEVEDIIGKTRSLLTYVMQERNIRRINEVHHALSEINLFVSKAYEYVDRLDDVPYYFQLCAYHGEDNDSEYEKCKR